MNNELPYPESFPNDKEELFLKMILCEDKDFVHLWEEWNKNIIFDDIDFSITRLLPLLYLRLKKFNINNEITGRIKGVYKLSWFKNQLLIEEVRKIVELFNKNNIPTILLKGIPLLLDVYKDRGSRILADGDILIDPKNALKAVNLLIDNGWNYESKMYVDEYINESTLKYLNILSHETVFTNKKNVQIDLHWSVFSLDEQWSKFKLLCLKNFQPKIFNKLHWKNSVPISINNEISNRLCSEDMLIHIIVHGSFRNYHRPLRWVIDSMYILNNITIDWQLFFENVQICGYEVEIYVALIYLIKNYGLKLNETIIKDIYNLKLNKNKIAHYYKNSNYSYSLTGNNFPFMWYRYWKFETKRSFPISLYDFGDYLSEYWKLNNKKEIPKFIFQKYKKIISNRN